jgi:hypothetical protein
VRRFVVAYLSACCAATLATLAVQAVFVLGFWGMGVDVLADAGSVAVIYFVYSLAYTLVLGLVGWAVLRAIGELRIAAFLVIGGLLGVVAAGATVAFGFDPSNPFLYMFSLAGIAAAYTFHRLYYGRTAKRAAA